MKIRTTTVVVVLAFLTSTVFAVGNIGPPTAELKAGQWSVGGDYAYSDIDLDISKMKYADSEGGSGKTRFEFSNVKTNFYYATLGYGLANNFEIYGLLGISDIKSKIRWPDYTDSWEDSNFDNDLVWGVGASAVSIK